MATASSIERATALVAEFNAWCEAHGDAQATRKLIARLAHEPLEVCIDVAQQLLNSGMRGSAVLILVDAHERSPQTQELAYWLAVALRACAELKRAEALLRTLAATNPDNAAVALLLAHTLRDQGGYRAAAQVLLIFVGTERSTLDSQIDLSVARLLDELGETSAAFALCARAQAMPTDNPGIAVEAGVLAMKLGQFEVARDYLLRAASDPGNACAGRALHALANAQQYRDGSHPDFALFETALTDPRTSNRSRTSVLFALGKACDDIGAHARAVDVLQRANEAAAVEAPWSTTAWIEFVDRRIAAVTTSASAKNAQTAFAPLFIIGMPRSGTTLLSGMLAQRPEVCARGELTLMEQLWNNLDQDNTLHDIAEIETARQTYLTQMRRDDTPTGWIIDKQPLNFRYVDFILDLFPDARFIYCRRDRCDVAWSVWMQYFAGTEGGFSYRWPAIAAVLGGCEILMDHWLQRFPDAIHTLDYEQLVRDPESTVAAVECFLDLAPMPVQSETQRPSPIATASMWQARQPVHVRSIGRSRPYRALIPALDAIGNSKQLPSRART